MTRASVRPVYFVLVGALSACQPAARAPGESPPSGAAARPVAAQPEPPPPALPASEEVSFRTSDGVVIAATLQRAPDPTAPVVVLVHQLAATRSEWTPLLDRLHAHPALSTLALDLRGHGASTAGPDGTTLSYATFDAAAWAGTAQDVLAAVAYVRSSASGLTPSDVAVVGASIGSSAALAAAAQEPAISTLVALSPGRAYHGFDAITPALALSGRTFLAAVATDEADSRATAQALARITHGELVEVAGAAHGTAMFSAEPSLLDRTERFLRTASQARPTAP